MKIYQATTNDIEQVAYLFNLYRQFYHQPSNIDGAVSYIRERLEQKDSTIFIAEMEGSYVGFVQLYPTFSSIAMQKALILNDLFVLEEARKMGIGDILLASAKEHALREGVTRLSLSTAIHNHAAQALYNKHGYERDQDFYHYQLTI
ncbi:GNAT family N-acetyltransferase [Alkalicoccobacillus porphyridii]|uniref:GNAT family N-acetyltransferase n=2 Tax=Alkalicoccobacillus porphyridii TaxID=2597270 RepID=A0A554A0X8_9BACI|nr:GNAT family N-acetyltransferase [Alkalicoccobacillus porphyridii]TSB47351.1 GNAT family N-acetyltransferase [Alkalicoccobacillus porphyridii]